MDKILDEINGFGRYQKIVLFIIGAMTSLNAIWQAATQEMYQGGQAGDPNAGQDPNAGGQSGNTSNNNGDVTDVEYEEVNDKK